MHAVGEWSFLVSQKRSGRLNVRDQYLAPGLNGAKKHALGAEMR